jgi:hypothetical protein
MFVNVEKHSHMSTALEMQPLKIPPDTRLVSASEREELNRLRAQNDCYPTDIEQGSGRFLVRFLHLYRNYLSESSTSTS